MRLNLFGRGLERILADQTKTETEKVRWLDIAASRPLNPRFGRECEMRGLVLAIAKSSYDRRDDRTQD